MLRRLREYVRPFYLRNFYFPLFPARKPTYFDTCWNFPIARPESHPGPVVLFLPMNDWHSRIQRTQHLALALAKRGYRCIYLNPHLGREFPRGFNRETAVQATELQPNLYELHVHLPREPVFHHRRLLAAETALLARAISQLVHQLGGTQTVQIVSLPVWLELAQTLRESNMAPIVYDCHDYLPGFAAIAAEILASESELFQTSDRVICSAQALIERAQTFGTPPARCVLIRNAAAPEFFAPAHLARLPAGPIRIGYVGALESWFDAESLRTAALAQPEWHFELVGRVESEPVRRLAQLPNVHLVGEVPFSRLPEILRSFTVAVIPFLLNPLIRATDPIKAYEYMAAGLPIVSSDLPELARFGNLIARYIGPADFVQRIRAEIRQNTAALATLRQQAAAAETWDRRADQLAHEIERLRPGGV